MSAEYGEFGSPFVVDRRVALERLFEAIQDITLLPEATILMAMSSADPEARKQFLSQRVFELLQGLREELTAELSALKTQHLVELSELTARHQATLKELAALW